MEKYECRFCGKQFSNGRALGGHIVIHSSSRLEIINKISKKTTLKRIIVNKLCEKCGKSFEVERTISKEGIENISSKESRFCSQSCANGHFHSEETKLKISNSCSGKKGSGYIDGRSSEKKCCDCGKLISYKSNTGKCSKCLKIDSEYQKSLSDKISKALKGKAGGYREKGGRGKQGWYKGYFCNSSWELAYVIYCLENKIKITRNTEGFEYSFENEIHKYYPDFILEDGSYVEIKGYKTEKVNAKHSQFKYPLEVIDKAKIGAYIDYVINKYGKDFVNMYE